MMQNTWRHAGGRRRAEFSVTTRIAGFAVLATVGWCTSLPAQDWSDPGRPTVANVRVPLPIEDDANLHDVQFVGTRHGWAVGDHGVIWHSDDGGETWSLQASGVTCPLHSVCFLSDRVGWVAGGGTLLSTRVSYGVILKTTDGGQTWQPLVGAPLPPEKQAPQRKAAARPPTAESGEQSSLPRIRRIRFFSPEKAIAVGEGRGTDPSGAFSSEDGGKTWRPLPGKAAPGWLGVGFLNPDAGVLVGAQGSVALVVEGKVVPPRVGRLGARNLYDVAMGTERGGWLVGDGGLVLQAENAGFVWQVPATPLPEGSRDVFDFRAVCCRGVNVWVAGEPGSTIWHSPDSGNTWHRQTTGQTLPLAELHFATDQCGWGIGALGTIVRTTDGGRTWKSVRGGGRRLAMLALFGQGRQVSLGLIAELSGEFGYRSLVSVVGREDEAPETTAADAAARLDEAVTDAGGSAGRLAWQLPLVIPGLERDFDRLVEDWNRRTDNRLDEVLIGALVRQIRTWRPSVLVIEQPETGNAVARLVGEAAIQAVEQADDATRFLEQQELAGLEPWKVERVFARLPAGSSGQVDVDRFRYLPHLGETTDFVASRAEGLLRARSDRPAPREAFRLVAVRGRQAEATAASGNLFAGISIPAGSAARRAPVGIDDSDLETRLKIAQKQRNFAAFTERFLDDARIASQLIGQLRESTRGMSPAHSSWQMVRLAGQYDAVGQWELAELTLIELIERYPDQPAALAARQRLMQLWVSSEVTWKRVKRGAAEQRRDFDRPEIGASRAIELVEARLRRQAKEAEAADGSIFDPGVEPPGDVSDDAVSGDAPADGPVRERRIVHTDLERKFRFWQSRALNMAAELRRKAPALSREPAVQFPLAALFRQRTAFQKADEIYRQFLVDDSGTPWAQAADGELWLTNVSRAPTGPVATCGFAARRPVLDGVLSDRCWRDADELLLAASPERSKDEARQALVKICGDSEYLYIAASLPRATGARSDGPVQGERRHDDDLADFDRVLFSFDVDRDYVTSFNFAIDQRGCTAESCWQDATWNPRWFVAVAGDKSHWRFEAAIPLDELTPAVPRAGSAWALGITRIIPTVGFESWTRPASADPHPETFGILRFDSSDGTR